ncbi:MAG: AI-2E family transporter [Paludibacter sp.]|nr:AI-2E family transporter [Paludibacter sp.]
MKSPEKPYTFDRVIRLLIALTIFVILFFLIKKLSPVLLPFFIAWLIAYLLQPFVSFFQYKLKLKNRVLSVISTLLLFGLIFTGAGFLFFPLISAEISKVSDIISNYTNSVDVYSFIPLRWQEQLRDYLSKIDLQALLNDDKLMDVVKKIAPRIWSLLNSSLSFIWGLTVLVIIFLYLFFILKDYENISESMFHIVPQKYRGLASEILHDLEVGMNAYFRGQALIALIVAVLFSIGFMITGLPLAIIFGLFIGVLNLVPYLKTIALIPGTILAFLQSVETGHGFFPVLLSMLIVFVVVQLIEDFFLVPKIMGDVTGLNPAVILLSLSVWGSLMGVIGLIMALPLTTLLISYYKRFVLKESKPSFASEIIPDQPENDEKDI